MNPLTPNGIGFVPVAAAGTPVQISLTSKPVKEFRVCPLKTGGVANTGVVYIGKLGMVKATGVGVYAVLRPTDAPMNINIGDLANADYYDLSNWYVDADTNADAILVGFVT